MNQICDAVVARINQTKTTNKVDQQELMDKYSPDSAKKAELDWISREQKMLAEVKKTRPQDAKHVSYVGLAMDWHDDDDHSGGYRVNQVIDFSHQKDLVNRVQYGDTKAGQADYDL